MLEIIVAQSFAYTLCISQILTRIKDGRYKSKRWMLLVLLLYIPGVVARYILFNETVTAVLYIVYPLLPLLTPFLLVKGIGMRQVICAYLFVYGLATAITTALFLITDSFYDNETFKNILDLGISIVFTVLFCSVLQSRHGARLRQQLPLISGKIKGLTVLSFWISAYQAYLVSDLSYSDSPENWIMAIRLFVSFLILLIGITCPILLANALSSGYYKTLAQNFEKQIEQQAAFYQMISASNFELRRFKHDYQNMRIGLDGALRRSDIAGAMEILRACDAQMGKAEKAPYETGNGVADALLADKQQRAMGSNTVIHFEGSVPAKPISAADLCVILGNTVDNAIEACEKLPREEEKEINVRIIPNGGLLMFDIENPVAQAVTVKDGRIETTKADKHSHGFGLYSLQKAVDKYKGDLSFSCKDNRFSVRVIFDL